MRLADARANRARMVDGYRRDTKALRGMDQGRANRSPQSPRRNHCVRAVAVMGSIALVCCGSSVRQLRQHQLRCAWQRAGPAELARNEWHRRMPRPRGSDLERPVTPDRWRSGAEKPTVCEESFYD